MVNSMLPTWTGIPSWFLRKWWYRLEAYTTNCSWFKGGAIVTMMEPRCLVGDDGLVSEGALHLARVPRPRDGAAVAARLADRLPRGGAARGRRLRRVRDRRPVDRSSCARAPGEHRGVPQRVPAPRHAARRGPRPLRRRAHPLSATTAGATRSTGASREAFRSARVRHAARRPPARRRCAPNAGAASCSSTWTPDAEPLLEFLDPLPDAAGAVPPARDALPLVPDDDPAGELEGRRRRLQRGLPRAGRARADPAVDRRHEHRLRAVPHPRALRPPAERAAAAAARARDSASPADDVDEGEILAALVAGLGGAFLKEERALVEELRATPHPPGTICWRCYQRAPHGADAARAASTSSAFTPEQMTSADDVYWFPNVVGPIYPGSAILFRVRPNGLDPDSAIKDTWVLEWPRPGRRRGRCPSGASSPTGRRRDWGEITTQDYENITRGADRHEVARVRRAAPQPAPGGQHPPHAPRDRPVSGADELRGSGAVASNAKIWQGYSHNSKVRG